MPEPKLAGHVCCTVGTWAGSARSTATWVPGCQWGVQSRDCGVVCHCLSFLQVDVLQSTVKQFQQFSLDCRQQAEDMCRALGSTPAANMLYELPTKAQKVEQHVTADVLLVHDLGLIWDKIHDKVWLPSLQLAFGSKATELAVLPWRGLQEKLKHIGSGRGRLLQQLQQACSDLPQLWAGLLREYRQMQVQQATISSASALAHLMEAGAASSRAAGPVGLSGRFRAGASGQQQQPWQLELTVVDRTWQARPNSDNVCKFWSGMEGSCYKAGQCSAAASHVPGQPTAWYQDRAQVYARHGASCDNRGNYRFSGPVGTKRPAAALGEAGPAAGGSSTVQSSFRPSKG